METEFIANVAITVPGTHINRMLARRRRLTMRWIVGIAVGVALTLPLLLV